MKLCRSWRETSKTGAIVKDIGIARCAVGDTACFVRVTRNTARQRGPADDGHWDNARFTPALEVAIFKIKEPWMNQTLKDAIRAVEALPEAEQEELAQKLRSMALSKKIEVMLAEAEAEGGETPQDEVFDRILRRHGQ
jgi:hypothetical protein